MPTRLERIQIEGFRSIKSCDLKLTNLNVLIGANGAGKSNFASFFKMMRFMSIQSLQEFVARAGHASSILRYGPKVTPAISIALAIKASDDRTNEYQTKLIYAPVDTLVFASENISFSSPQHPQTLIRDFGAGHKECGLMQDLHKDKKDENKKIARWFLSNCRVFQFHDTSSTAPIRAYVQVNDNNNALRDDGGNLAAVLYWMSESEPAYYQRTVATIRQLLPFFKDFVLEADPRSNMTSLRWRDYHHSEYELGPHQLSDGSLRVMTLVTLLQQPEALLPSVIVIDEPELGLHPAAISIICSLVKQASHHAQIILATQSPYMVNQFSPEDIIVVERENDASVFKRLDPEGLKGWLEDYSLAELWDKNVFGGQP